MELSLNKKHDQRDKVMAQFEAQEEGDEDQLRDKLKEVNSQMDQKRKEGLKILKKKLNDIIQDEDLHADARLQKLYDEGEIMEFMLELLN